MHHAKKMVLIPEDAIEKIQQGIVRGVNDLNSVQTPGTTLSRLDNEMSEILKSVTPENEREKWKLYQQVLQRYQFFTEDSRHGNTVDSGLPIEKNNAASDRTGDSTIIETVPKRYKKQAQQLLNYLQAKSNGTLTWDNNGLVSINGEKIRDSNIIDLVNDAMRERKSVNAIGRAQFSRELQRIGVPREFVGNPRLWNEPFTTSTPQGRGGNDRTINDNNSNVDSLNESMQDYHTLRDTPTTSRNQSRKTPTNENLKSWITHNLS